ncbi:hypothetical protein V6N13_108550 [Hibiscus sabdariffa]
MFAKGESCDRYWRRKRQEPDSKNSKTEISQPIVTQIVPRCFVEGIIDEDKVAILNCYTIGFSRKPCMIADMAREFQKKGIEGFSVIRIVSSLTLLMFDDDMNRMKVLESNCLTELLERIEVWTPSMGLPNWRAWLSVSGLPINVWSEETFSNIANLWRKLARVDAETLSPSSERAIFQVETGRISHIDELLDVKVVELVYTIHVTKIEETIRPKCDFCCVLMDEEGSCTSETKDSGQLRNVTRQVSEMASSMEDTMVPNSLISKGTIEKIWEGNVNLRK